MDSFSLVLSGGGALGIAELGVISDMEKIGIVPSEIVGTSMGGIIGACVSISMKESEIFTLFEKFSNIFNWIKFSFSGNSVIKSEKIRDIFDEIFKDLKLKDTKIPLKLIATNLQSGDIKVFDRDDDIFIKDALLATMAIPGIFEEQQIDGSIYVDGFICENLGINQVSCENILAVDVLGGNSFDNIMPNNLFKTQNVIDMFEKSMRLIVYNQTKINLANSDKNIILIEPKTSNFKTFHFHKFKEIRKVGKGLLNMHLFTKI